MFTTNTMTINSVKLNDVYSTDLRRELEAERAQLLDTINLAEECIRWYRSMHLGEWLYTHVDGWDRYVNHEDMVNAIREIDRALDALIAARRQLKVTEDTLISVIEDELNEWEDVITEEDEAFVKGEISWSDFNDGVDLIVAEQGHISMLAFAIMNSRVK